jgi:hypothetical protein
MEQGSVSPLRRWNDDRLDDLQSVVNQHTPVVNSVGELRVEIRNLSRELEANTKSLNAVTKQFEDARVEPLTRSRTLRNGLVIACSSAVLGGGIAVIGALLAGGH